MACFHPLTGYRARTGEPGARPIVFDRSKSLTGVPMLLPCGQCVGCRLERSRQWAVRCVHEASLLPDNCFITLTYADEFLPPGGTLVKRDFQLFMKRLRKSVGRLRFYYCGEYGESAGRPHYHALLFGYDFPDKYIWRRNRDGDHCFRSPLLERLWPFGSSEIGSVTFKSSAYVARYIMKKRLGPGAEDWYMGRLPEYTDMSRRPGIGRLWFDEFTSDVYPRDFVVMNAKKFRPPRAYDNYYELLYPGELDKLKLQRKAAGRLHKADNTPERLRVREVVEAAKVSLLKRE